jgi:hypothetical protein
MSEYKKVLLTERLSKKVLPLSKVIERANCMFDFRERNGEDCSVYKNYVIAGADIIVRDLLSPNEYDEWANEINQQ